MKAQRSVASPIRFRDGRTVLPVPGPCIWCGEYVESDRATTGATDPLDASWTVPGSGDFGCSASPYTGEEGTGDHCRPYDLAVALSRLHPRDIQELSLGTVTK